MVSLVRQLVICYSVTIVIVKLAIMCGTDYCQFE